MANKPEKRWWELPVRMMRVDYAPDFSQIKDLDLDAIAKRGREEWKINCEWVVGSMSFEGRSNETTFASKSFVNFPGFEDFDYLRTYVPIAHARGLRVLSYLNMHWYKYEFAEQHPGWEQITSSGVPYGRLHPLYGSGTTMCVNSPWREWAFQMMREAGATGIDGIILDGPVVYPDSCYCDSCKAQFKAKYGVEIPTEDWNNPHWREFIEFREESLAQFVSDGEKALHEVNPEATIAINAGGWQPQGWRVARDIQKVAPYQNFNMAEAFFHYGQNIHIYASLMMGKYLRMADRPAVVATHYMNGVWHYLLLPPNELKIALIQTAASGTNPWLAIVNSSLESQPDGPKAAGEVFGFMEDNSEYYTDLESVADVGLLFSHRTACMYLSKFEQLYNTAGGKEENLVFNMSGKSVEEWSARKQHCENFLVESDEGYFTALTRNHILFDILLDQNVTSDQLAKYTTLILPDAACLDDETAATIRKFVEDGGCLLASFEAGFYNGKGEYTEDLFDLLGIEKVEGAFKVTMGENYSQFQKDCLSFRSGQMIERAAYVMKVKAASDSDVPAILFKPIEGAYIPLKGLSEYPSLIVHNYGKGKVAYYPEAVGQFFGETGMVNTEKRIADMVKEFVGKSVVELDAAKTISMEVFKQADENRMVIHLVNNTIDGRPVNEFIPVHDLKLTLSLDSQPKSIRALRENKDLNVEHANGSCTIRVPMVSEYEVIAVDL